MRTAKPGQFAATPRRLAAPVLALLVAGVLVLTSCAGLPDKGFGVDGIRLLPPATQPLSIQLLADGRIMAATQLRGPVRSQLRLPARPNRGPSTLLLPTTARSPCLPETSASAPTGGSTCSAPMCWSPTPPLENPTPASAPAATSPSSAHPPSPRPVSSTCRCRPRPTPRCDTPATAPPGHSTPRSATPIPVATLSPVANPSQRSDLAAPSTCGLTTSVTALCPPCASSMHRASSTRRLAPPAESR